MRMHMSSCHKADNVIFLVSTAWAVNMLWQLVDNRNAVAALEVVETV
jgi:hypothetical protein